MWISNLYILIKNVYYFKDTHSLSIPWFSSQKPGQGQVAVKSLELSLDLPHAKTATQLFESSRSAF